jgi:two-component system, chemotaxis family, sensor kinase Cph1
MKWKDIVNRDLLNLTNCDQEPIHIPGSIQQHGFLLGLKIEDLAIDYCSGNAFAFTGMRYEELLGKNVYLLFGEEQTDLLKKYISSPGHSSIAPMEVVLAGKMYNCTVELNGSIYILELEPAATENIDIADIYQQTKQFTDYMQKAATLQSLCQLVANETRAIIGFDRVMIYRFDKDYNGEVFAESKAPHVEPFFGLHYPHTDIPAQARDLFIKNFIRLIVDVNYAPVPIYTIDDGPQKNLDLTLSSLRSVSPIHIQYLKNMGVGATLTISLMHENRLWGLIACHHYSPKYIPIGTRIAAKLQGDFLTSQISVRQLAEEYEIAKKISKSLDMLLSQIFSTDSAALSEVVQKKEFLALANATGLIMVIDNEVYSQGIVPHADEIKNLVKWLFTHSPSTGFSTSNLSLLYAGAGALCNSVSGVIFHELGPGNCIVWCRPEALQEVNWAGNPDKAVMKDENGLTPRQSFELWKEVKKCESNPWQNPELAAAANLANALQQHVNMLLQKQNAHKQKQAEELIAANTELAFQNREKEKIAIGLTATNKELEQLTYIASHDLQEPLRTISNYMQVFREDYDTVLDDNARKYLQAVTNATRRMSLLIKTLLDFSRLGFEKEFILVDMKKLIGDVIADLQTTITSSKSVIEVSDMPQLHIYETEIRQVFQNLIGNAIKFHKNDTGIIIKIGAEKMGTKWKFSVSDNGIGIDPAYCERIFDIFQRLHSKQEFEGHGIGLAFCRKIIQLHHGEIWVESSLGKGAIFYFTL